MTTTPHAPRLMTCPDCTATAERVIEHDDTCPTLRRIERVCGADEAWFLAHPFSGWRWRDLDQAEQAEVEMAGYGMAGRYCRVLVIDDGAGSHRRVITCDGAALVVVKDIPPGRGWAS